MPNHLMIVPHRLNGVDELELFDGCHTAEDPKLMMGLQQLTHRAVRAAFHTYLSACAGITRQII